MRPGTDVPADFQLPDGGTGNAANADADAGGAGMTVLALLHARLREYVYAAQLYEAAGMADEVTTLSEYAKHTRGVGFLLLVLLSTFYHFSPSELVRRAKMDGGGGVTEADVPGSRPPSPLFFIFLCCLCRWGDCFQIFKCCSCRVDGNRSARRV